ncbi:DsbA family protein [Nostoc sp.]|uniref:DsbA family protein n=1 Tax=Nostoc sp. TaxID=1180 RepID=UPI002FFA888F
MPQFLWNFSEHVYTNRVQADFHSGVESGVADTPTFFINGDRYDAHWSFEALQRAIKASISQAT